MARKPINERIEQLISPEPNSGCWLWLGSINNWGYGIFNVRRGRGEKHTSAPAHRASYEAFVGPIPEGLELDHECRNHGCVNPSHLAPVTPRENKLRGNGAPALNARKTHCVYGHPFSADNTDIVTMGGRRQRRCRTCWVERVYPSIMKRSNERYARLRAERLAAAS